MKDLHDAVSKVQDNGLSVVNIVCNAKPQDEIQLDFEEVQTKFDNEYGESTMNQNKSLTLSYSEDNSSQLLFENGNIFILGYTDPSELEKQYNKVTNTVQKMVDTEYTLSVSNIIVQKQYDVQFNLNELIVKLGLENVEYNPESFVGVFYRQQGTLLVIFSSQFQTTVMCMGEKNVENIINAYDNLESTFEEFPQYGHSKNSLDLF